MAAHVSGAPDGSRAGRALPGGALHRHAGGRDLLPPTRQGAAPALDSRQRLGILAAQLLQLLHPPRPQPSARAAVCAPQHNCQQG